MKKILTVFVLVFLAGMINAQTLYLTMEPNHSTLGFEVDIAGGASKITGKFMESDLRITYKNSDWTQSTIDMSIRVHSLTTGIPDRDKHLMTADFFNADTFPLITFVSERIEKREDGGYTAYGDFTMHGITKQIGLPFEVTYEDGHTIGIHVETSVSRIEHGVGSEFKHTAIENFLSDEIDVKINFWTKKDKTKGPKGIPKNQAGGG